jgi:predicted GNAT family N-acyltransferase
VHILGEENDEPMAAGRIRFLGEHAKLERIVVRRAFRGKNYGHRLVDYMLNVARNNGFTKFKIHAQAHLKQFYEQHGFEVRGDIFKEADIDHYLMICTD